MRIFNYELFTYVHGTENQGNYNTKGQIIVEDDSLTEEKIRDVLVRKLSGGERRDATCRERWIRDTSVVSLSEIPKL